MNDHINMDYSQIDDHIWVGTNACCETHFKQALLDMGITADVSLEENRVDSPFGVESYLWLPTKDHAAPSQNQLALGARHIKQLADSGHKVYIHCKNGHGRGPTMAAAYYVLAGKSVEEAITLIAEKRTEIHIEDVQRAALERFQST